MVCECFIIIVYTYSFSLEFSRFESLFCRSSANVHKRINKIQIRIWKKKKIKCDVRLPRWLFPVSFSGTSLTWSRFRWRKLFILDLLWSVSVICIWLPELYSWESCWFFIRIPSLNLFCHCLSDIFNFRLLFDLEKRRAVWWFR